jgi:hypothetical protein
LGNLSIIFLFYNVIISGDIFLINRISNISDQLLAVFYGFGALLSLANLALLPLSSLLFVGWFHHYRKTAKVRLLKWLFTIELPILLLSVFAIAQEWFNFGALFIYLVFYLYVLHKFLIVFGKEELVDKIRATKLYQFSVQFIRLSVVVISVYFFLTTLYPFMTILLRTLLSTEVIDIFREQYFWSEFTANPIEAISILFVSILFWILLLIPLLIFLPVLPSLIHIKDYISDYRKCFKEKEYLIQFGTMLAVIAAVFIGIGSFNQNYNLALKQLDSKEIRELVDANNPSEKRLKKREIVEADIEDFEFVKDDYSYRPALLSADFVVETMDEMWDAECFRGSDLPVESLNCKRISVQLEKIRVPYRHLLSYTMPLQDPPDKYALSRMLQTSVYDNCQDGACEASESGKFEPFEYGALVLTDFSEEINVSSNNSRVIEGDIRIEVKNPDEFNENYRIDFELPDNSIIKRMKVGDQQEVAQLVPQNVAEKVYQEEVTRHAPKDPTLLTSIGKDRYRLKVFPVEPNSFHSVRIEYIAVPPEFTNDTHSVVLDSVNVMSGSYFPRRTIEVNGEFEELKYDYKADADEVVVVVDMSRSMNRFLDSSQMVELVNNIDSQSEIRSLYAFDSYFYPIDDFKELEEMGFVGHSNRVVAFNELFKERELRGRQFDLIVITDDSPEVNFQDHTFQENLEENINGIGIHEDIEIDSMVTVMLDENSTADFVDSRYQDFSNYNSGEIIHTSDYYGISHDIFYALQKSGWRDYLELLPDEYSVLDETYDLANNFNYSNRSSQRVDIGKEIYQLGLDNEMLVPFTTLIYVETEEQQESLEIGMDSNQAFDKATMDMAPTGVDLRWYVLIGVAGLVAVFARNGSRFMKQI